MTRTYLLATFMDSAVQCEERSSFSWLFVMSIKLVGPELYCVMIGPQAVGTSQDRCGSIAADEGLRRRRR